MRRLITEQLAIYGILTILSFIVLFHLLILLGVLPYTIVWGGNIADQSQMLRMEVVSVLINLLMLTVVAVRAGFIRWRISKRLITVALWIMAGLFALNTLGNLLSQNQLEKMIFTPLTLILSLFCLRLAINTNHQPTVGK